MSDKKMGRPPLDNVARETRLFIKVSENEAKELEELANYLKIPLSVFVRNLVLFSLDNIRLLKEFGLLDNFKGIIKTSEALKKFRELKLES